MLREEECWVCKIDITRREFRNPKGNQYSPEYIGRELRHIHEDMPDRVERKQENGVVWLRYIKNRYETAHEQLRL